MLMNVLCSNKGCLLWCEIVDRFVVYWLQELKTKDDQYVRDLKKEMEDIDLLIERINNLVEELRKAYRLELDEIEVSFTLSVNFRNVNFKASVHYVRPSR